VTVHTSLREETWTVPPAPVGDRNDPRADGGIGFLLRCLLRRRRLERELRSRAIELRSADAPALRAAYERLSREQFAVFNALQRWTHARVLPRVLRAVAPTQPCTALDLGCGSGDSTQWLVHCVPPGSLVVAYDFSAQRLATARSRTYRHADGSTARVRFVLQHVAERLLSPEGRELAAGSVGLVLTSGVVGHHFDARAVERLATELRRVLRADGTAVLDAGPRLRVRELTALLAAAGFRRRAVRRLGPFNCRAQVVFGHV
jgi:SAM-dependent methyltransferase